MLDIQPDNNGIYVEGNKGWFISRRFNQLYEINLITNQCTFLAELPESGYNYARYNTLCYKYNNSIWCLPDRSNKIWIYNLISGDFSYILMPLKYTERWQIRAIHRLDNFLFLFSLYGNCICKVNLNEKNVNIVFYFSVETNKKIGACMFERDMAYMVVNAETSYVCVVNLNTYKQEKYLIDNLDNKFNTICKKKSKLFLTGNKKEVVIFDLDNKSIRILNVFPEGFGHINFLFLHPTAIMPINQEFGQNKEAMFSDSFVLDEKVWFIPLRTSMLLYLDTNKYEIREVIFENETENEVSIQRAGMKMYKYFLEFVETEKMFRIYSFMTSQHYVIDTVSLESKLCEPSYSLINSKQVIQKYLQPRKYFSEGYFLDNEMYEVAIEGDVILNAEEKNIIGDIIYSYLKK